MLDTKNEFLITGVLSYMQQTTAMHDATAHAIGLELDSVPNTDGKFGADFEQFAKDKWRSVWKMLAAQYNEVAANKPLLDPSASSGPLLDYPCAPPFGATAPLPPP